jgi:hypothetical protein
MKLNNTYWIYAIECIPTGQIYVGQTGKPNPCWRWSEHVVQLRNGISQSPLLQSTWNTFPDLTQWQFRALAKVTGKRSANHREAELILEIPENKRLNTGKTSTVSLLRRRRIEQMLNEGRKYTDIRKAVGISMGMISKMADLPL